jgi:hypothetical protein
MHVLPKLLSRPNGFIQLLLVENTQCKHDENAKKKKSELKMKRTFSQH